MIQHAVKKEKKRKRKRAKKGDKTIKIAADS